MRSWSSRGRTVQTTCSIADLDTRISQFEETFGMSSDEFLSAWRAGGMDDSDFDLNRWALLLAMRSKALAA